MNNNIQQNLNNEAPVPQDQAALTGYTQSITTACRNCLGSVWQSFTNFTNITNLWTRGAQVEVPETNVDALAQQYQGLIECESIGDGNYKLSIVDKDISNEKAQEILEAFKNVNVAILDVNRCRNIIKLSLQNLPKLCKLDASLCEKLKSLDASGCKKLETLNASDCTVLKTLDAHWCTGLTKLDASGCEKLKSLDVTKCTVLKTLDAHGCTGLTKLDVSMCKKLKTLDAHWCTGLTTLNAHECEKLKTLDASWCWNLETLDVTKCTVLKTLDASGCWNLETLDVTKCTVLKTLDAHWCTGLTKLNASGCKKLKTLNAHECEKLQSLDAHECEKLKSLDVTNCIGLTELDASGCKKLKTLNAHECTGLTKLDVSNCTGLTTLNTSGCTVLTTLDASRCTGLTKLDVSMCKKLKTLNASDCTGLTELDVSGCTGLKTLDVINCTGLTTLDAYGCAGLTTLNASWCTGLTELNFSNCTGLTTLDVNNCTGLTKLDVSNCTGLTTLDAYGCAGLTTLNASGCTVLTALDAHECTVLTTLNTSGCTVLTTLFVSECENLHGELDISGAQQLGYLYITNCAEDFVVVISSECPLAQRVPDDDPNIRIKSIKEQCTSFLNKEEDKHVVQRVIDLVRGNDLARGDQKSDCLNCLKNYCERYVNASEGEKARAAKKYISALNRFSVFLNKCSDAFATGLARLKIELELGNLLKSCNTAEERRQVLFGVYAQEQIERSIVIFDTVYQDLGHQGIGELVELQLALNVVLNVPHSENMSYAGYAATVASAVTNAYNANANELRDLIVPGETFLETYNGIMPMFLARTQEKLGLDEDKAQSFEVPLKIMITSMLNDKKFSAFLLNEEEYLPLAAGFSETTLTVDQLEAITGETDDTRAIKAFIQKHKGQPIDPEDDKKMSDDDPDSNEMHTPPDKKRRVGESMDKSTSVGVTIPATADPENTLSDNPTLADVFFFLDNNSMKDDELYKKVAGMISPAGVATLQQQAIGNLYSEANYEDKLAEHLQNALVPQQQQVNVNQPEDDEQAAEMMQLE